MESQEKPPDAAVEGPEGVGEPSAGARDLPPAGTPNRRKEIRHRLNKVLGAELFYPDGSTIKARLFVINISSMGFRATCNELLPLSDNVRALLSLSIKDQPLEGRLRICWQKALSVEGTFDHGFEIVAMEEEPWRRLARFIQVEVEKAARPDPVDLKSIWSFGKVEPTY